MLETIVGALLPAVITVLLGYVAARHHDFDSKDAPVLTRMVMTYALPLAVFVGTVSMTRGVLIKELPLLIALSVAMISLYSVVFLVCRFVLRFSPGLAVLCALAASAPDVPFVGPTVVSYLYGPVGSIPVAIGSFLINITVVPVTVILLSLYAGGGVGQPAGRRAQSDEMTSGPVVPPRAEVGRKIVEALKEPIVWLPLVGFTIVLMGIRLPALIVNSLALLGHAAAGVALFTVGVLLACYQVKVNGLVLFLVSIKNIVQPALVWVGLLMLGYTNPLLGEAVLTAALPMITLTAILGVRYRLGETEAASAVFMSFVGSLLTIGLFIALTGGQSFHAEGSMNGTR